MTPMLARAALLSLAFTAVACGTSPEKLCKKLAELDEKEQSKKWDDKQMGDCVTSGKKDQVSNPKAYECFGGCLEKPSRKELDLCMEQCVTQNPTPSAQPKK